MCARDQALLANDDTATISSKRDPLDLDQSKLSELHVDIPDTTDNYDLYDFDSFDPVSSPMTHDVMHDDDIIFESEMGDSCTSFDSFKQIDERFENSCDEWPEYAANDASSPEFAIYWAPLPPTIEPQNGQCDVNGMQEARNNKNIPSLCQTFSPPCSTPRTRMTSPQADKAAETLLGVCDEGTDVDDAHSRKGVAGHQQGDDSTDSDLANKAWELFKTICF